MLVHLVVKHALVRILHLSFVHTLLLELLLGLGPPLLFPACIILLKLLFFFLLAQGEIGHMLRVDVSLLVKRSSLMSQKPLLISIPGIVLEFGHRRQIAPRLTRFHSVLASSGSVVN